MTAELATAYKSGSQKAGNVTEAWGADNFYCPNCSSPKLDWLKPGTKANDYRCPSCKFWFQLKSQKTRIANSITDGAYKAMMDAIREDRSPNFYILHYDLATWTVRNLLLIPHFAFPPSAIIKRKPLSATARRAGWVGCNFDLTRIPVEARIAIVANSEVASETVVREKFRRVKPLKDVSIKDRGWTLDVLNIVHRVVNTRALECGDTSPLSDWQTCLPVPKRGHVRALQREFTNADIYAFERELERLHPGNRHIKDKIRQQLQVLRDRNLLLHVGRNCWRLP